MTGNSTKRIYSMSLSRLFTLLIFIMVSGCGGTQQFKTAMFQPNDFGGWGPNGLTWNGRDFVIGDGNLIIEVNSIETGRFIRNGSKHNSDGFFSFARTPEMISGYIEGIKKDVKICGMAWEGECCGRGFLWIADSQNKLIIKLDAYNKILKYFPTPGDSPHGLAFDGKNLWVGDSLNSKIYKISTEDGAVLSEFNSPVKDLSGLAWDCSNIWVSGIDDCKVTSKNCYKPRLLKLDLLSGKVTSEIDLPNQLERPSSLVWVDGIMWIADHQTNRIFKVPANGHSVEDETVYRTTITFKPRKIEAREMSIKEAAKVTKKYSIVAVKRKSTIVEPVKTVESKVFTEQDPERKAETVAYKEHTVVTGDTLWDISSKEIADPFLWPKIWKENPEIKNPDRIYPGQKVKILE